MLWAGRPQNAPFLKRYLSALWPLLFLILIPVFNGPVFFFAVLSIYYFFYHWDMCRTQTYLLTNKRALIINKSRWIGNIEIPAGEAIWLHKKGRPDYGTIWFSEAMPVWPAPAYYRAFNDRNPFEFGFPALRRRLRSSSTAFFNIQDRDKVVQLLPFKVMPNP